MTCRVIHPLLPFGYGVTANFTILRLRSLRKFTYVHHTNYLALAQTLATRKIFISRLRSCILLCLVTLSDPLFIQDPRFIRWYRWFCTKIHFHQNNFYQQLRVALIKSKYSKKVPTDNRHVASFCFLVNNEKVSTLPIILMISPMSKND